MEFPTVALIDSFQRTESPLSNGGKWTILPLAGVLAIGRCYSPEFGWVPNESHGGAYWNAASFNEPALHLTWWPENAPGAWLALWACFDPATKSGYRLRAISESGEGKWEFKLEKCVEGTFTTLSSYKITGVGSSQHVFGLTVLEGKLKTWHKFPEGEWTVLGEVADATYTAGRIGLEGDEGGSLFGETLLEAASQAASEPPTLEKPADQVSHRWKALELPLVAVGATSYSATGLPKGLTINALTGEITGAPTTLEETTVKVTAKNGVGETSREFHWTINAALAPLVTKPANQTSRRGAAIAGLQVAAESAATYTATGLPAGLTINEATGLITGTPTTVAVYHPKVTVTNETGEASAEWTWTIQARSNNQMMML